MVYKVTFDTNETFDVIFEAPNLDSAKETLVDIKKQFLATAKIREQAMKVVYNINVKNFIFASEPVQVVC